MRGTFSSRFGFILAAAGSAVGLGNIWGFPTQVASNGGAAFVLVYLILAFLLAYPVLVAELLVGRYAQSNSVDAYGKITGSRLGRATGYWGMITVSLILSFYAIVGGWMIAYLLKYIVGIFGLTGLSEWLTDFSLVRNILFCALFSITTAAIISGGVNEGIERWSKRLMPMLLVIIIILIGYVATLEGAAEGWKAYWLPDFARIFDSGLVINAMGQAFFSLSLGVGTMLIYGSYLSREENLSSLGASVALVDIGIAILAGLLIIPAMYVAQANGISIFDANGDFISGDGLVFSVLPSLFSTMHGFAILVPIAFFALMVMAALTSSISMLEVPVSYTVENHNLSRNRASITIGALIFTMSTLILLNFELLFGLVIQLTTVYSQPLLGLVICIFVGWLWNRNQVLEALKEGNPSIADGWFWKIWPTYVKFVCPAIILLMFYHSL